MASSNVCFIPFIIFYEKDFFFFFFWNLISIELMKLNYNNQFNTNCVNAEFSVYECAPIFIANWHPSELIIFYLFLIFIFIFYLFYFLFILFFVPLKVMIFKFFSFSFLSISSSSSRSFLLPHKRIGVFGFSNKKIKINSIKKKKEK